MQSINKTLPTKPLLRFEAIQRGKSGSLKRYNLRAIRIDRLRPYISIGESQFEEAQLAEAKRILNQLQRFANFVDFSKPILTFTGIRPDNPNDEKLGEDIDSYGGSIGR